MGSAKHRAQSTDVGAGTVPVAGEATDSGPVTGEEKFHAAPPRKSAFRRWFSTLNPSLQLVLLQLWMPLFMAVMFVVCYVGAFEQVTPHQVPVGVVGSHQVAQAYQQAADAAKEGAFLFSAVDSEQQATSAVRSGELGAVYDPGAHRLVVASAHQAQAANLLPRMLAPFFAKQGAPQLQDVAPLAPGDIGMTPMYLMLAWCIAGYLATMFIGLMGGPLSRRVRFGVIAGVGWALSGVMALLVSPVIGAVHGHFWALWGLGWAWSVAIGLAVNGLSYFCGRFIAAPAMTIFIFLSIPASGAALPQWLMPEPFRWLNHVVVGSGITEMLKRLIYDVGPGYARGWIMMLCYAVVGLLLTAVGKSHWRRLRIRRMATGRTTMMTDAQRTSGQHHEKETEQVLSALGLRKRPDGTIVSRNQADGSESGGSEHDEREIPSTEPGGDDADSLATPNSLGFGFSGSLEHELDEGPNPVGQRPRHGS